MRVLQPSTEKFTTSEVKRIDVVPVILEGTTVRLEPLRFGHCRGLCEHVDLDLFKYFAGLFPAEATPEACHDYIRKRLELPSISFAIVLRETDLAVGHTSYMDIQPAHRSLEIGSTWIGKAHQGTKVNPECKFLLLQHAFETLECFRVQLKTDERNLQSQRGIEKLGAKKEGILRRNVVLHDGFVRNTVMYSITSDEWPTVKAGLLQRLSQ